MKDETLRGGQFMRKTENLRMINEALKEGNQE